MQPRDDASVSARRLGHLERLEAESIHIMREVAAEFSNPVMLYGIGKDSSVMLHLAMKAFHPSKPPFPLLHIDTAWNFREATAFRDATAQRLGLQLIVHGNEEGLEGGVNPVASKSSPYTRVMKTNALTQALEQYGFDAAIGGTRRDEETGCAKDRIFSFCSKNPVPDPNRQRPELWKIYNTKVQKGETLQVFPLANWTELDVWQYVMAENISIVPLYFAKHRPVVRRNGVLIAVDDDRMKHPPGESPEMRQVRFRTLGCYPLTGAIESSAATIEEIVGEMLTAASSERQGGSFDRGDSASMEDAKREGYS